MLTGVGKGFGICEPLVVANRSNESKDEGEKVDPSGFTMCGNAVLLSCGEGGPADATLDADEDRL